MTGHPPSPDWDRLAELFEQAVALPPGERDAWIEVALPDDPGMRATLRRMLVADASDADLLDAGVAPAAGLILEPEQPVRPGDAVGQFDIIGTLGRGGMGVVFEARDRHLGRVAALKFLPAGWPHGTDRSDRLLAEAKAASALDHPNVAGVYQVGTDDDGRIFIAMPRYEGETLHARLAAGPMPAAEAVRIARAVAAGLAAAHRAGIIHRDLSPSNIFLTSDGQVKILDFGLASNVVEGDEHAVIQGTASAMSPEQARGGPVDPRTDVWAVGVLLYRMLAGSPPFEGASTATVLTRILDPAPSPSLADLAEVPAPLARLVERLLAKNPAARPADGTALLALLDQLDRSAPRSPAWRLGLLGTAALVLAGIAWVLRPGDPPAPEPVPALMIVPPPAFDAADDPASRAASVLEEVGARLGSLGLVRVVPEGDRAARGAWQLGVAGPPDTGQGGLVLELRRGANGPVEWRHGYPISAAALPTTSRQVAADLLARLGIEPTPREQAALAASFPSDPRAYGEYLEGNRLLRDRTPAGVVAAISHFEAAHALDSTYVPALARQAYAYSLLLDWGWSHPGLSRDALLQRARQASDEALRRDRSSAEAWLARAYVQAAADPYRLAGAPEAFQRAIALDPYNSEAFHQYGQALMVLGRWDEARTAYRRALELDPGYAMSLIGMSGLAEIAGDRAHARAMIDSVVAVAPEMAFGRATRGFVYVLDGQPAEARREAVRALELDPDYPVPALGVMAMAAAAQGDSAEARARAFATSGGAEDPAAPSPDEATYIVLAWLAAGETDSALSALERTRPRGASLWYLFQLPAFAQFREDPRAAAILLEADPRPHPSTQVP